MTDNISWICYNAVCRLCSNRWVAVFDDRTDYDNLECPNCRHMTGEMDDATTEENA